MYKDKNYRDKGCIDKEIQEFRRSDKGFRDKGFGGCKEGVDKEFSSKDLVDKKSASRMGSAW